MNRGSEQALYRHLESDKGIVPHNLMVTGRPGTGCTSSSRSVSAYVMIPAGALLTTVENSARCDGEK